MLSCVTFGYLYDREKLKKQQPMFLFVVVIICASWLGFLFIQEGSLSLIILGQVLLGIRVGAFVGPTHAFLQKQFSPQVRYTGVASGFSLGMALSGSTTLLLMSFVIEKFSYKMAPSLVIFIAVYLWFIDKAMKKEIPKN